MFYTVKEDNIQNTIEIKKSKFIAYTKYVQNKNEVDLFLDEKRKEHPKARHIVYAYNILENGLEQKRAYDDKEPSKTAGAPILDVIVKNNLRNVIVVVVRYFGGILLGTGGLVKAYSDSASFVLEKAGIVKKSYGKKYTISLEYEEIDIFKREIEKIGMNILSTEFLEKVNVKIFVSDDLELTEDDVLKVFAGVLNREIDIDKNNIESGIF